ncbi:hypothetical protein PV648_31590 [Streptomyces sp. ID05-47C]|nr:hypothetical protein [Streptomyces sp. ID05-47C]MDX3573765.1 hypothetical protein [Streptomyces sp. ID05-47C]
MPKGKLDMSIRPIMNADGSKTNLLAWRCGTRPSRWSWPHLPLGQGDGGGVGDGGQQVAVALLPVRGAGQRLAVHCDRRPRDRGGGAGIGVDAFGQVGADHGAQGIAVEGGQEPGEGGMGRDATVTKGLRAAPSWRVTPWVADSAEFAFEALDISDGVFGEMRQFPRCHPRLRGTLIGEQEFAECGGVQVACRHCGFAGRVDLESVCRPPSTALASCSRNLR